METKQKFSTYLKKLLKTIHTLDWLLLPITVLRAIAQASLLYIGVIYGGLILDALVAKLPLQETLRYVYQLVGITGGVLLLIVLLNIIFNKKIMMLNDNNTARIIDKNTNMDYMQLESKKTKAMLKEAVDGANANGGFQSALSQINEILKNFISLIYSFILIAQLFVIAKDIDNQALNILFNRPTLSLSIIIIVFISTLINRKLNLSFQKAHYEFYKVNVEGNRIFGYLFELSGDYNFGKDFRIYNMNDLILGRMDNFNEGFITHGRKFAKICARFRGIQVFIAGLIMLVAYFYVGTKAYLGFITIGSVVSISTAIIHLNTALVGLITHLNSLKFSQNYMIRYFEYLELGSEMYHGTLPIEKRNDNQFILEFKNVSFAYPDSDLKILKNVSYKLTVGQKLAIVGPNGAGKTTFIKLLCRLYDPTEGEILLNGINIQKYDYQEYVDLLAVVFQDFKLFAATIADNVSAGEVADEERITEHLRLAGFSERLQSLEKGMYTDLYQSTEQGVEISGGEAQKIAIARALYKDAPIVILDEPTAALDPISEAEIYAKFDSLVEGKTSIYISHRMSSCRFCDHILVFDDGEIKEQGTHESLLQKGNLYKEMWNAQAKYYQ